MNNFTSGSNKKISKNKIPAAPTAFFITREEPIAVPATLWTIEPAPGINPIILLSILFFAPSKDGAIIVSSKWNPKEEKIWLVFLLLKENIIPHTILKYSVFERNGWLILIENSIEATEEIHLKISSLKKVLRS